MIGKNKIRHKLYILGFLLLTSCTKTSVINVPNCSCYEKDYIKAGYNSIFGNVLHFSVPYTCEEIYDIYCRCTNKTNEKGCILNSYYVVDENCEIFCFGDNGFDIAPPNTYFFYDGAIITFHFKGIPYVLKNNETFHISDGLADGRFTYEELAKAKLYYYKEK